MTPEELFKWRLLQGSSQDPLSFEQTEDTKIQQKLDNVFQKTAQVIQDPRLNPPERALEAPVSPSPQVPGTTLPGKTPQWLLGATGRQAEPTEQPLAESPYPTEKPVPLPSEANWVDPDSYKLDEQEYRLSSYAPNTFFDAPESAKSSNDRYATNKKAFDLHRRHFALMYGMSPDDVTKQDLHEQEQLILPQVKKDVASGAQYQVDPQKTGRLTYGRPLVAVTNKEGEDIGEKYARNPETNFGYYSPFNKDQQIASPYNKLWAEVNTFRKTRSIPEAIIKDPAALFAAGTLSIVGGLALETGHAVDSVIQMMGGPATFNRLDKDGVLTKGLQDSIVNFKQRNLSSAERKNAYYFQKQLIRDEQVVEQQRPEYVAKYGELADVYMQIELGKRTLTKLVKNPSRLLGLVVESLPTVLVTVAGGYIGAVSKARKLEAAYATKGLNWKNVPEAVKEMESTAKAVGITSGSLMEGASSGNEIRANILNTEFAQLEKESPDYRYYISQGYTPEGARAEVANTYALRVGAMVTGLTGLTMMATGAGGQQATALLGKAKPGIPSIKDLGLTKVIKDTFKGGKSELLEESFQSLGQQVISTDAYNKALSEGPPTSLFKGTGQQTVLGGAAGFGTGGIVTLPGSAARTIGTRLKGNYTYEPNEVKFTQKKYEDRKDKLNPQLWQAISNVGMPITITSGTRLATDPVEAVKAKPGYHVSGDAVDIDMSKFSPQERKQLVLRLYQNGANRFGTYDKFPNMLHVDMGVTQGRDFYAMHNTTATQLDKAPDWFKETINDVQESIGKGKKRLVLGRQVPTGSAWAQQHIPDTQEAQTLNTHISSASEELGLPPVAEAYLRATVEAESNWGENLQNPTSSASGPWQFTDGTKQDYGLSEKDALDPETSTRAAARHLKDAYTIQKAANPNLPDSLLWYRAAISLHQGRFSNWKDYKDLTPESKVHADKLAQIVTKYVSAPLKRGSTTTPQQTPIANQTRQTYVEAAPTEEQTTAYKEKAKTLIDANDPKAVEEQFKKFTSKNTTDITRADIAENNSLVEAFENSLIDKYQQNLQSQVDKAVQAGQSEPNLTELLPEPEVATIIQQGFDWIEQARAKATEAEQFLVHKEVSRFTNPEATQSGTAPTLTDDDAQYFIEAALQGNLTKEDKDKLNKIVKKDIKVALNNAFDFSYAFDVPDVLTVAGQKLAGSDDSNFVPLIRRKANFLKHIEAKKVGEAGRELQRLLSFINGQEDKIEKSLYTPELMDLIKQEQKVLKRAAGAMAKYYNSLQARGEFKVTSATGQAPGPQPWVVYTNDRENRFGLTQASDKAKSNFYQRLSAKNTWGIYRPTKIDDLVPLNLDKWIKARFGKAKQTKSAPSPSGPAPAPTLDTSTVSPESSAPASSSDTSASKLGKTRPAKSTPRKRVKKITPALPSDTSVSEADETSPPFGGPSESPTKSPTKPGATTPQGTPTEMPTEAPESPQGQSEQPSELTPLSSESNDPEIQKWWEEYNNILNQTDGIDFSESEMNDEEFYPIVTKISNFMDKEIPKNVDNRLIQGIFNRIMEEVTKRKFEAATLTKLSNQLDELNKIERTC